MQALKANQVCLWQRKDYQDLLDRVVNPDFLVVQVHIYHPTVKNPADPQSNRKEFLMSDLLLCCTSCCQVVQVSLDSLVFQVYQEPRVILDSRVLDCQDPQEPKVRTLLHPCSLITPLFLMHLKSII